MKTAEIEALGEGYRLQGSANLDEVADVLHIAFGEEGEYDTIAGFFE